jgi:SOS response associated peptidase (SRAP)
MPAAFGLRERRRRPQYISIPGISIGLTGDRHERRTAVHLRRALGNWKDSGSGEWLRTCSIITGESNELVTQIHPGMPVILPEQYHAAWLGETDDGNLKALLVRQGVAQGGRRRSC